MKSRQTGLHEGGDRLDWLGMGIGFGITFAVVAMGIAWRARRRGHLLLDTGVLEGPLLSSSLAAYIPVAILLAGAWLWSRTEGLVMMSVGLAGVLAVVVVMKRRIHLRFTELGICFLGFIKWGEIRSYRWNKSPEGGEELELGISMNGRNSSISFPIPAMHRERIAEILAGHVPRGS